MNVVRLWDYNPRHFAERAVLDNLPEEDIFKSCRMSRAALLVLRDIVGPELERETHRNKSLSVDIQLLTALEFYSSGAFQWAIGNGTGLTQPSVSRCIDAVTDAICRNAPRFIRFPSTREEILREKQQFRQTAGFPSVIGCVDGTHVPIKSPGDNMTFMNRKGYSSINVQVVCDSKLRFTDVVAKWPGSCHDAFIWRQSGLRQRFEMGDFHDSWLLGKQTVHCVDCSVI
jgi:hypothetical protein